MKIDRILWSLGLISLLALAAIGCSSGDTDGGSAADKDFLDTQFVATPGSVGDISLSAGSSTVAVGDTESFTVRVTDVTGAGVTGVQIACDTERGLALVEPTSGTELTGTSGAMSGLVGCLLPGSFQMVCRGPVGLNFRRQLGIQCSGTIPPGFGGFPGAGGGGLGGGVQVPGDDDTIGGDPGGVDSGDIRITKIDIFDVISEPSLVVDVSADPDCNDDGTFDDREPFVTNLFSATVENNANTSIILTGYRFSVPEAAGTGTATYVSSTLSTGRIEIPPNGGSTTVPGLFTGFMSDGTGKTFVGREVLIPGPGATDVLGFRNMTFTLLGQTAEGDSISISGSAGVLFNEINNCDS